MKTLLLAVTLGGLLALSAGLAVYVWVGLGDTAISSNGVVALVLGVVATMALGIGLMWLVFYSSRKGYDEDRDPPL